jgi:hypothetical protein
MTFDYEKLVKTAEGRLETLYEQKASIESEISRLEQAIKGFIPLVKNPAKWLGPKAGVTDAIRAVLKSEPNRIHTATEIRDELLRRGMPLKQKNPMATIHQVLSRLVDGEEVTVSAYEPGRNRYKWKCESKK